MRAKSLLVLAVVVGALLALIYFAEDKVASTDERAAAAKRLVNAEADEIVALEIDWQGSRVRFERTPPPSPADSAKPENAAASSEARSWRIVAPFAHRADDAAVARLLAALSGLEASRDLAGAARADVGLEPPRGTVTWKTAAGEARLEIGGAVPASHDLVVAASGRRLLAVTGDSFLADLTRPAGDWRSREVMTAGRERIEKITLAGLSAGDSAGPAAGSATVLARSGETLRLESPVADLVDRDLADRLLADLAALRMETFLDPPLPPEAERALAAPVGSVELTLAGESRPQRIEVGAETAAGKRIWRADGQAFESASPLAAAVARPAAEWRSRNWTRFENWRIEKARVEAAAGSFELVRSEGEWLRDGRKIPFTVASDLLAAITSAKAESLAAGSLPASPAPPRLAITLADADGNEELLTLPADDAAGAEVVPARTGGRDVTLFLPRTLVSELEQKIAAARSAAPIADPPPPSTTPAP